MLEAARRWRTCCTSWASLRAASGSCRACLSKRSHAESAACQRCTGSALLVVGSMTAACIPGSGISVAGTEVASTGPKFRVRGEEVTWAACVHACGTPSVGSSCKAVMSI